MAKTNKLNEYNWEGYPDEHMQLISERLNNLQADKSSKCKLFELTFIGPSRMWFNTLSDGNIES